MTKSQSDKSSLVFFGTGSTSLEALQALCLDFTIEAVITKPATNTSSGHTRPTEVEIWAKQNNLEVFTPSNKSELSKIVANQQFESNVGVVLDFGMIVPQDVINSFSLGIINSHFSLLPLHRGADPIRAAILEGDKTTGVTIMKIVAELDAGPILTWAEYDLRSTITEPELRTALSELNCALLPESLTLYLNGDIDPIEQDVTQATFTSKVSKDDGLLDATKSATQLEREIRAYITWPKSYILVQNQQISIKKATVSDIKVDPGKLTVHEKKLYFGCKNGSLEIIELQPAGKASMSAQAFTNGYKHLL